MDVRVTQWQEGVMTEQPSSWSVSGIPTKFSHELDPDGDIVLATSSCSFVPQQAAYRALNEGSA